MKKHNILINRLHGMVVIAQWQSTDSSRSPGFSSPQLPPFHIPQFPHKTSVLPRFGMCSTMAIGMLPHHSTFPNSWIQVSEHCHSAKIPSPKFAVSTSFTPTLLDHGPPQTGPPKIPLPLLVNRHNYSCSFISWFLNKYLYCVLNGFMPVR